MNKPGTISKKSNQKVNEALAKGPCPTPSSQAMKFDVAMAFREKGRDPIEEFATILEKLKRICDQVLDGERNIDRDMTAILKTTVDAYKEIIPYLVSKAPTIQQIRAEEKLTIISRDLRSDRSIPRKPCTLYSEDSPFQVIHEEDLPDDDPYHQEPGSRRYAETKERERKLALPATENG